VAIDLNKEVPIPLKKFGGVLLQAGHVEKRPAYGTVRGWWRYGRKNHCNGKVIRLEAVRTPKCMATTMEAYYRFLEQLTKEK
jgi:hypothetical protein